MEGIGDLGVPDKRQRKVNRPTNSVLDAASQLAGNRPVCCCNSWILGYAGMLEEAGIKFIGLGPASGYALRQSPAGLRYIRRSR